MKILERWQRSLCKKLIRYNIITPRVIVQMDGGICSQMFQYLIGKIYLNKGYEVMFDLTFYEEWGSDMNRQFVRNFDLLKAFPDLKMGIASSLMVSVYKQKYYNLGNNTYNKVDDFSFLEKKPPVYLGGYYYLPPEIWIPVFKETFKIGTTILDEENRKLCFDITSKPCSVAVHVRRGDLKVEIPAYGKPASMDYFKSSISYMQEKVNTPFFYFFSDEPEWVQEVLIPYLKLTTNKNCIVVDINGSDKGYQDLFLIAHCMHQITSKGTLGKYGALLNDSVDKIVVLCDDETEYPWQKVFCNSIFL